MPTIADHTTPEDLASTEVDWARGLLSQLPRQQADVVMLRVIGGLSVDEVAAETGLTPANVRVLCHRGLNRLRQLVATDAEQKQTPNSDGLAVTGAVPRAI